MNKSDPIITSLPAAGYTAVLGTAGSGKTAAALKRAIYFAEKPEQPRVLLVTWNRLLAADLLAQHARNSLPRRLTVTGFPDLAVQLLKYRGILTGNGRVLDAYRRLILIRQALQSCQAAHPEEPLFFMPAELFSEELRIMAHTEGPAGMILQERTAGTAEMHLRICAEAVRRKYMELRTLSGWRFDPDDLPAALCRAANRSKSFAGYAHIIADDAQDFSPVMLNALYHLLEPGGSLTLFADPAQQITGNRYHWQDAGLPIGQTLTLKQNLRSPVPVRRLLAALRGETDTDGRLPHLNLYPDADTELSDIAVRALRMSRSAPAAVLCRNYADVLRVRRCLVRHTGEQGSIILHGNTAAGLRENTVYLSTYSDARGLEFAHVLLPFLSAAQLPHPAALLRTADADTAAEDEKRLLYCAAARASQSLYLSASGTPSPLIPEGCLQTALIQQTAAHRVPVQAE